MLNLKKIKAMAEMITGFFLLKSLPPPPPKMVKKNWCTWPESHSGQAAMLLPFFPYMHFLQTPKSNVIPSAPSASAIWLSCLRHDYH
jgi:hypothetical protein